MYGSRTINGGIRYAPPTKFSYVFRAYDELTHTPWALVYGYTPNIELRCFVLGRIPVIRRNI